MPRSLKPCGTHAAYKRHMAHFQVPCKACKEANRVWIRERRVIVNGRNMKDLSAMENRLKRACPECDQIGRYTGVVNSQGGQHRCTNGHEWFVEVKKALT